MSHWSAPFVGLPYLNKGRSRAGVDCWGLVHQVYTCHLGHAAFPSYDDRYRNDEERREIAAIVADQASSPIWHKVEDGARAFDVLFFRIGRWDSHAGVAIDARLMLHVSAAGGQSVVERWDQGRWAHTLAGVYRYVGRAA